MTTVPSEHLAFLSPRHALPAMQSPTEEVVGRRDGMDVARQVKVELLHWDHLRIASPGCPTYQGGVVRDKGQFIGSMPRAVSIRAH